MDLENISKKILKLDEKIRSVVIAHKDKTCVEMREGLTSLMTPEETEKSIDDAISRWETRKKLVDKLGEPLYAMAEYEKVKRIILPLDGEGLILITMDPEGFHEVILKEIIEIKDTIA